MLLKIQSAMNNHEKKHPEQREMNTIASKDLKGADGEIHPSRPLAMHVAYTLDDHHHNRPIYAENYDNFILPDEKEIIDDEALELSKLSSILHDPEYIFAKQEESEDLMHSKELLKYLLEKSGPANAKNHVIKELFEPYMKMLHDKVHDDDSALHLVLAPNMVKRTPHHKDHYSKNMRSMVLFPAFDGHVKQHWEQKLPEIFRKLMKAELY